MQLAPAAPGKLYLEVGSHEGWPVVSGVRLMTQLLERKGYRRDAALRSLELDGVPTHGLTWSARLERTLRFLLVQDVEVATIQAQVAAPAGMHPTVLAAAPAAAKALDEPEADTPAEAHLVPDEVSAS